MAAGPRKWVLSLGLAGIFLAGCITGVVGATGYIHHKLHALHSGGPHAFHRLGMTWLDWKLDLNDQQAVEIESILREAHGEFLGFKDRHGEEIHAIVVPALERVDAVLTPEQEPDWREIRARIVGHFEAQPDRDSDG